MPRVLIFIFVMFYCFSANAQPGKAEELIERSLNAYAVQQTWQVAVKTESKSAIDILASEYLEQCYYNRKDKKYLREVDSSSFYVTGHRQYDVPGRTSGYSRLTRRQKKHGYYRQAVKNYPFLDPTLFFRGLTGKKFGFQRMRPGYVLIGLEETIKFDEKFRIVEITRHGYDNLNKGKYFTRRHFEYLDDSVGIMQRLENMDMFCSNVENKYVDKKMKTPAAISMDLLSDSSGSYVNGSFKIKTGKRIFVQFFFQGCYPCVLSYPDIKDLQRTVGDKMDFIAIDVVESDSATALRYAEKYQLNYPILVGVAAKEINHRANVTSWPTFLIIDERGRILKRKNGYSKQSFRKMKRFVQRGKGS